MRNLLLWGTSVIEFKQKDYLRLRRIQLIIRCQVKFYQLILRSDVLRLQFKCIQLRQLYYYIIINNLRMFNSKLALTLAALFSISVTQVQARFLGVNDTQPLVISPLRSNYNSSLQCGECVLGGYVFCVKGPEQYSGSAPIPTFCCQNKTSCAQVADKSWSCSSKYENNTLAEKLSVCPFDSKQCGPQNLSFSGVGDAQCLRNNIKKGNACLYKVKSQCGVPRFQLSDNSSNVFLSSVQLSNSTIPQAFIPSDADRCVAPKNQTCTCRTVVDFAVNATANRTIITNTTRQVCNCETALNITVDLKQCSSCRVLRDSLGNLIRQCTCSLVSPTQTSEDQFCQCQRVTDLITKASSLNCTCAKPVPARSVTLPEESCKCVTSFNTATKSNFLDCVCKNAPICQDPLSLIPVPPAPAQPPCSISYPCDCQSLNVTGNNTQNLQCSCLNPSTGVRIQTPLSTNQCGCQIRITNSSAWTQDCKCCLADEVVRTQTIPPVICSADQQKQDCQCFNASSKLTPFKNICNCTNPQSQVVVNNLDTPVCDCNNISLGSKPCRCCVGQQSLSIQLQPKCASVNGVSTVESCQCSSANSNGTQVCTCNSRRINNFTFPSLSINASQCYCAPALNGTFQRACNCCVSDAQYMQTRQACPVGRDASSCMCNRPINGSLAYCDCNSRFFFNTVTANIPVNPANCACFQQSLPVNSTIAPLNGTNSTNATALRALPRSQCTCCTGEADLVRPISQCQDTSSQLVKCNQCSNVTNGVRRSYQCNCVGVNLMDLKSPAQILNLDVTNSTCSCVNLGNRSTCDCCVSNSIWSTARPICGTNQTQEKCNCRNVTTVTNVQNNTVSRVNVTRTFQCRPTGCSGEICGNVARGNISTSCRWNNTFACFKNATCEYQNSTGDCGWTYTNATNQCIARNATADPKLFQNLTTSFNITVRNITSLVNVTKVDSYNITNSTWSCNCSNSRYFKNPLINAPVTPLSCGTDNWSAATQQSDCCLSRKTVDDLYLASQTCSASQSLSNCQCSNNMTCDCQVPNTTNRFYDNISLDNRNSNCTCVTRPGASLQECKCCLFNIVVPAAPVCPFNSDTFGCTCDIFAGNYRCNCTTGTVNRTVSTLVNTTSQVFNNVTKKNETMIKQTLVNTTFVDTIISRQVLPQSQCQCLNILNGNSTQRNCNCCVPRALQCGANTTAVQNCDCQNVTNAATRTWQWNCGCTRRDTNIRGNFSFSPLNCSADIFGGPSQCCVTKPQFDTQVPTLTCGAATQRQGCSCTNTTDPVTKRTQLVCGCTRVDNGVRGNFQFTPDTCLCSANATNCSCCVPQSLVDTQIPRKTCLVEGNGTVPQYCDCRTLNFTVNGTRTVLNNCNCSRPEFLFPRTFNFTQTGCICPFNNSRCECCVSPAQRQAMIPQVQCNVNDTTQTNCQCTNTTVNGQIQQTCSCNFNYQSQIYTMRNLTSARNGCTCNGTSCGCCLTQFAMDTTTQKVCSASETRSQCSCTNGTLNSATKKLNQNCTCTTFGRDFTVFNFTYNGLTQDQCQCRSLNNCTCCIGDRTPAPVPAVCNAVNATASVALPRCQCFPGVNGTQVCNCTRTAGSVETYNNNLNLSNCSCLTVSNRTSGSRAPLECSCCATPAQVATPAPVCAANSTAEQCSCLNINDAKGRKGYNCDCNYKNIFKIREINFPVDSQCTCSNTNTLLKPCQCCISVQQYRDATIPKCDSNATTISTCVTANINGALRGNCSTNVNIRGVNTTYSLNNVNLSSSQCGCFNDDFGRQICRCCNAGSQDITRVPDRQCRIADQLPSSCECPVFGVNQTSANCSCIVRNMGFSYNFPALRQNTSDCSCVQVASGNRTFQSCSCCAPRNGVLNLQSPICSSPLSSIQRCNCRQIFNATRKAFVDICDCPNQPSSIQLVASQQCACLNQTTVDGVNSQNCSCCVPNPPLTQCQRLAAPGADMIGCKCGDTIINGKATFGCNCTKQANATTLITRNNMMFDELRDCCCTERQDPITRKGFKQCNCSHPIVPQNQNCVCRVTVGANQTSNFTTCTCTDCNRVNSTKVLPTNKCQCQLPRVPVALATNVTNSTSSNSTRVNTTTTTNSTGRVNTTNSTNSTAGRVNTTTATNTTRVNTTNTTVVPQVTTVNASCSCQVDFQGLCPQVDLLRQARVDEGSCDASNRLQSPIPVLADTNCKNQYEYLVAVVASNQDSTVLMQMQSYQFQSASYIKLSLMLALASIMVMLY